MQNAWLTIECKVIKMPAGVTHSDYTHREHHLTIVEFMELGNIRLSHMGNTLYAHNCVKGPTRKQRAELENLAIENGYKYLSFDDDIEETLLWEAT